MSGRAGGMPTHGLDHDYPLLWAAAKAVDDAERSGRADVIGPLHREMETAIRELWDARAGLVGAEIPAHADEIIRDNAEIRGLTPDA